MYKIPFLIFLHSLYASWLFPTWLLGSLTSLCVLLSWRTPTGETRSCKTLECGLLPVPNSSYLRFIFPGPVSLLGSVTGLKIPSCISDSPSWVLGFAVLESLEDSCLSHTQSECPSGKSSWENVVSVVSDFALAPEKNQLHKTTY